jgi:cytochrome c
MPIDGWATSTIRLTSYRGLHMGIRKVTIAVMALLAGTTLALAAAPHATKDEAVAMVNKAVAAIKAEGVDKAYAEISTKGGKFSHLDLYIVVYGLDGKVLAHGANQKLIGKQMIDAQDVDGKYYIRERVAMAQKQPSFWQDYKFVNPVTKKIEPKTMYCRRLDETLVCAGVYK